ncbi:MAG: hypothetical protein ACI9HK_005011, partial [Pirellulaceae bacterium]
MSSSFWRMTWAGLNWAGLNWAGLNWAGLNWAGLNWAGLNWAGLNWVATGTGLMKRRISTNLHSNGDQLIAHVDREHVAYAKHPILDKERGYFAFQVDESAAAFDNVQILKAAKHPKQKENLEHILKVANNYPVTLSLEDRYSIQKSNAHEWLYQRHEAYRNLVKRVDELDEKNKKLYPEVFKSHKEFQKDIATLRKKLHAEDPQYKETLFATFRADRAIEKYLISQKPTAGELPESSRKRELERLRIQHGKAAEYVKLVKIRDEAQQLLKKSYPQIFLSNDQITKHKNDRRKAANDDPEFKKRINERGDAYRAQQQYLFG